MTHTPLDIAWVLLCAALVMLMQAGFCCLESGLVRSKNSINVAFKNFVDFLLSSALYWVFGFALMFGATQGGLFGTTGFFFDGEGTPRLEKVPRSAGDAPQQIRALASGEQRLPGLVGELRGKRRRLATREVGRVGGNQVEALPPHRLEAIAQKEPDPVLEAELVPARDRR